jgi:hypothetical protein
MANQMKNWELAKAFWGRLHIEEKYISTSLWELLKKLNESWSQKKIKEIQRLCNLAHDLLQAQRALRDPQVNLSYIEGVLNAHQGAICWAEATLDRAEEFLRRSAHCFTDSGIDHYNASVVQMALGGILEQQSRPREALKAYQQSLHHSKSAPKCDSLCKEVMEKFNHLCNKLCSDTLKDNSQKPAPVGPPKLRAFPIVGLASAGAMTLTTDKIEGYGIAETITIDSNLYNIHLLKAGKDVYLHPRYRYVISPVEGDSMNLANIQDGNYVLFEKPADGSYKPKDGDIVLAITSSGATIKRYHKEGGDVWLQPESSNESHSPFPISQQGKPLADQAHIRIAAKAIAVLKEI